MADAVLDLKGLTPAQALAVLYNASRPQGMGFLQYQPEPMTTEQAEELLGRTKYFDYLQGRVMKLSFKDPAKIETWLYDRDNGQGAAQRAIDLVAAGLNEQIGTLHKIGVAESAGEARDGMQQEMTTSHEGGFATVRLGLSDMAPVLGPKVAEALKNNNIEE